MHFSRTFLHRTDALADRLGINVQDLPSHIGVSRRTIFAGRESDEAVSVKTWRLLEKAEQTAGISTRNPPPKPLHDPDSSRVAEESFERLSNDPIPQEAMWLFDLRDRRGFARKLRDLADEIDPPNQSQSQNQ